MAKKFEEVRIPFTKMTFSPDVPSTALGPNEYNDGLNVETDVRGIRSTAGDQAFLEDVPDRPTFVTGGYRQNGLFYFIVACENGTWHANNGDGTGWHDISPGGVPIPGGYTQAQNITDAWNGTVPFFNDAQTAPMFWPDEPGWPYLIQYSQQIPLDITNISAQSTTVQRVSFSSSRPIYSTPFAAGEKITLTNVSPRYFNGQYVTNSAAVLVDSTSGYVDIICSVTDAVVPNTGQIAPLYSWNYDNRWNSVYANFMRIYNSPNVGSILVAGNLTAEIAEDSSMVNYPVTVQWSQAFGLNQAPFTWTPTVTNVANQLEVPLRGPALDAFPCNGQFFLCSYWDTVVFSPINYATTATPILGVRIFNQGRGLLSSNCWANTDKMVYGVDARDIWVFDGNDFQGLGNQRVKNWFYDQLDPQYYDRVFMEVNTQKNQVEIYYPDSSAVNGVPNKMLSYRYDLDCWNAPRDVSSATLACESPIWTFAGGLWSPQGASRTTVYARGEFNEKLVQKDIGYTFADGQAISSSFVRDNIKLLPDYSGKLLVHRVLPEAVNIGAIPFTGDDEKPIIPSTGNITVKVSGANSVGQDPDLANPPAVTMTLNTDYPWIQVNQNAFRVNRIELSNTSNTNVWMCSATTWQYTQTEDDH